MHQKSPIFAVGLMLCVMTAVVACSSSSPAPATGATASSSAALVTADRSFTSVTELGAALHDIGLGCDSVESQGRGRTGTCQTSLGLVSLYTFASVSERDSWETDTAPGIVAAGWCSTQTPPPVGTNYVRGNRWIVQADAAKSTSILSVKLGVKTADWCTTPTPQ
jgi:hypothetical protein